MPPLGAKLQRRSQTTQFSQLGTGFKTVPTEAARGALYRRITVKLQLISKNAIQQPSQLIIINSSRTLII